MTKKAQPMTSEYLERKTKEGEAIIKRVKKRLYDLRTEYINNPPSIKDRVDAMRKKHAGK